MLVEPRAATWGELQGLADSEACVVHPIERLDNDDLSQVSGGRLVAQIWHVQCSKCGADYICETSMMSEPPWFCRECDARIRAERAGYREER